MATVVVTKLVTPFMLYTLIIRYQRSLNSKVDYDTDEITLHSNENGISENYLCHCAITKRKFPLKGNYTFVKSPAVRDICIIIIIFH